MLKDTMSHAQLSLFTEVATVILVAIFAGAVLYLYFWRPKASWKAVSELPLQEDLGSPARRFDHAETSTLDHARAAAAASTHGSTR